jgi:hypothetical protein
MAGTISSVSYVDPWGVATPGTFQSGLVVQAPPPPQPDGLVIAACLVQGSQQVAAAVGASNTMVRVVPPSPLSTELPYLVWIQWVTAGTQPTWPAPGMLVASVVVSIPAFTSIQASLTAVAATWAFAPGAGGSAGAAVQLFDANTQSNAGYFVAAGSSGNSSMALAASTSYVAYLQAAQPAFPQAQGGFTAPYSLGPFAPPTPVTAASPAITSVAFDGAFITVGWTPVKLAASSPQPPTIAYQLELLDGTNLLGSLPAGPNGGLAALDLPLRGRSITVAGSVALGVAAGPTGTAAAVLTAKPSIAQAVVAAAGGSVVVQIAPGGGLDAVAWIQVELVQDGVVVASGAATGSPPSVTLQATFSAQHRYAVRAYVTANTTPALSGPNSSALAVIGATVASPSVIYDGKAVVATWPALEDTALTGYEVTFTVGTTSYVFTTTQTALSLPGALTPGTTGSVTVRALSGGGAGRAQPSAAAPFTVVPPSAPAVLDCFFDGHQVLVDWQPSSGPGLDGYLVTATGKADGSQPDQTATWRTALSTSLALALPFDDTLRTWTITVAPTVGAFVGAASPGAVVYTATPALSAVTLGGQANALTTSLSWSLGGITNGQLAAMRAANASLQIRFLDGGTLVSASSQPVTAASGTISKLPVPTGTSPNLAVAARIFAPGVAGAQGGSVALLTVAPTNLHGTYDGSWLLLTWSGVAPGVTGHLVTLQPATGSAVTLTAGAQPTLLAPLTLSLGTTWGATVQPVGVNTTGLSAGTPAITLPTTSAPVVTLARYDGGWLTVAWSAASPSPNTSYVLNVLNGSTVVASQHASGSLTATLELDLAANVTYSVVVASTIGGAGGPSSAPVALQQSVATLGPSTTDPLSGTMTLSWSSLASASGYKLRWSVNGQPAGEVDVSGTSARVPLSPGATLAAAVAGVWTTGGATVIAPYSAPSAVATSSPSLTASAWDGTQLTVRWGLASGSSGTRIVVTKSGATSPFYTSDVAAPADELVATLPVVDPAASYTVTALALFGTSSGPLSPALPMLLASPSLSAPSFDGRNLTVAVSGPPGVSSYQMTLVRNGQPIQTATGAAGANLTLPVIGAVDSFASYSLSVRACAGSTLGPPASIAVVMAAPVVVSLVCATRLTVTAAPGPLPSSGLGMSALLYTDGVPGTAQPLVNGTVQLDLPPGGSYAVAVQGTIGSAVGPWSPPVPALTVAPTALAAGFDAHGVQCAFEGALGAHHRVSLLSAGTPVAETVTDGLEAAIAYTPTAQVAYSLQVCQVSGVAVGPPALLPLVSDGCAITSLGVAADRTTTVAFTAPANPASLSGVQPVISWGQAQLALPVQSPASPLTLSLPANVPNGAVLSLRAAAGAALGPAGAPATLFTTTPTGLTLAFANNSIAAAWDTAPAGTVDGYLVTLSVSGSTPPATRVAQPWAAIAYTPAPSSAATVSVALAAGVSAGPALAGPVLVETPTIASADFDGATLRLAWSAATDPHATSAQVALLLDGVVAQRLSAGGTSAALPMAPGPFSVTVSELGAATSGPPSPSLALLTARPDTSVVGFDSLGTGCTLSWPPLSGAGGYQVRVFNGTSVVLENSFTPAAPGPTVSFPIPAATFSAAGGQFSAVVRALDSSTTPKLSGPWSSPQPLLAAAPAAVSVAYDGVSATISWSAVASPLVSGYLVTALVDGAATLLGQTTATRAVFALSVDPTKQNRIVVQALSGAAVGAPSVAQPVLRPGWFFSTGTAQAPAIAPRIASGSAATDVVVYLPNLFTTPPQPAQLPISPPFVLAPAAAPFSYTLTIPASSIAWTFGADPLRTDVQAAYLTLLGTLSSLTATPLGIRTLQDAIARAMPQTFVETLYYAYGFSAGDAIVDLRPGTLLRAEYESYQLPAAHSPDADFLDGFVASGTAQYEVMSFTSSGSWLAGLDAFLAQVAAAQGFSVQAMPPDANGRSFGGGGLVDAFFPQFLKPYCRLVYPTSILLQSSIGSPFAYDNPVLLAAATLADLETATRNLRDGTLPGGSVASFYFRGRTTLTALIRVLVDGESRVVPLGTTVGNLLEALGSRPPLAGLAVRGLSLTRPRGAAISDAAVGQNGYLVGDGLPVRLDWASGGTAYGAVNDWLDLPLLGGDQLVFDGAGS